MNSYSTISVHQGPSLLQNGGPKHRHPGNDNPSFRMSDPYTIPIDSFDDDFMANNLVNGHIENDQQISSTTVNHNSVFESKVNNYATVRQLPTNGTVFRSISANGRLKPTHTLGRSSATVRSAYPFGTISRGYLVGLDDIPRHQQGSKKKSCISFFDIETDKVSSYQYRPGEDITGKVTILIRKNLEIRFVDMIVTGHGRLGMGKSGFPHTVRETYLQKEKCIIGAREASLSSVLTPGRYTSQFRVKLPTELPSTIHNEDSENGTTFDITYTIRVRICDDGGGVSPASMPPHSNRVRVFLEKQINFNVQRGFDVNTIPDFNSPIVHTEQVYLACTHQQPAIVSINLDRAVFLAGDDIRMHLQVSLPSSHSVKEIICKLQELITIGPKQEPILLTLSKIIRKNPHLTRGQQAGETGDDSFAVTMPTHTELVSPFSLGNSQIKFGYFLLVELKFTPAGGKLSFKVNISELKTDYHGFERMLQLGVRGSGWYSTLRGRARRTCNHTTTGSRWYWPMCRPNLRRENTVQKITAIIQQANKVSIFFHEDTAWVNPRSLVSASKSSVSTGDNIILQRLFCTLVSMLYNC